MVNARLHIICGNCGSVDLDFIIDQDSEETSGYFRCNDCATLHFLNEKPKQVIPPPTPPSPEYHLDVKESVFGDNSIFKKIFTLNFKKGQKND